jgi:hypothetical protein
MDGAFGARGLVPAEGAPFDAFQGVSLQLSAVSAKPACGVVAVAAIHADHDGNGYPFTGKARFSTAHGEDFTSVMNGESSSR